MLYILYIENYRFKVVANQSCFHLFKAIPINNATRSTTFLRNSYFPQLLRNRIRKSDIQKMFLKLLKTIVSKSFLLSQSSRTQTLDKVSTGSQSSALSQIQI